MNCETLAAVLTAPLTEMTWAKDTSFRLRGMTLGVSRTRPAAHRSLPVIFVFTSGNDTHLSGAQLWYVYKQLHSFFDASAKKYEHIKVSPSLALSHSLNPPHPKPCCTYTCARARTHTHTHTRTHARKHARTHARTHTHRHAHTQV